jgi:GTP-binding protein YchF
LGDLLHPRKLTPVTVEYLDLPGLSREIKEGGSDGPLFNQLRQVDLILHVIRDFENPRVPHPAGSVDPLRDIGTFNTILLLADLEVTEKRIGKIAGEARKGRKEAGEEELPLLERCREWLLKEQPLREIPLQAGEERLLRGYALLTLKPLLLLLNVGEEKIGKTDAMWERVQEITSKPKTGCVRLAGKTEWELRQLDPKEALEFSQALGLEALEHPEVLRRCLTLLDVITFYTTVGEEVRAWAIPTGSTALQAAGTIHTDMAKGFIKAEVIPFEQFVAAGSLAAARKQGLLRLEGKEYPVRDGDIVTVRFSG